MKEKTLVILAAGMGSRFGGLKQIEPVGPNKEIIADYSVYDAIRTGFTKVVFVIREEHFEYFKENITNKYADKIEVSFAFQELDRVPSDIIVPNTRRKMFGTTHALLCAKDLVNSPFVMINSDDFYGRSAYEIAADFLDNNDISNEYLAVNYPISLASSKNGKVNRGVVKVENGYVVDIDESVITVTNDKIIALSGKTGEEKKIFKDQPVSLNFFGFKESVFKLLEDDFNEFIHGEITDTNECFLPTTIKKNIYNGNVKLKAEVSSSRWLGVTYKEDLEELKQDIQKLIENGEYPDRLW